MDTLTSISRKRDKITVSHVFTYDIVEFVGSYVQTMQNHLKLEQQEKQISDQLSQGRKNIKKIEKQIKGLSQRDLLSLQKQNTQLFNIVTGQFPELLEKIAVKEKEDEK